MWPFRRAARGSAAGPFRAPPEVQRWWSPRSSWWRSGGARRIRPTREGWIFALTGLAVCAAALNTGNNLLYLLLALLLGVLALSGVLSELAIRGIAVERQVPGRVYAGVPALGRLVVHNPRRWAPHLALEIREVPGEGAELATIDAVAVAVLLPGQRQSLPCQWTFSRRGHHRLGALRVATRWPFGLLEKWYERPAPQEVVVYAAPSASVGRPLVGRDLGALRDERALGDGDFKGLKDLGHGEDPRLAHPRISARRGRPTRVERDEERGGPIEVVVEVPGGSAVVERLRVLDQSVSAATGALLEAERAGRPALIRLFGRTLRSAGPKHGAPLAALAVQGLPEDGP